MHFQPLSNRLLAVALTIATIILQGACRHDEPFSPTPYNLILPSHVPPPPTPPDNPLTKEGVELGRLLFHDPRLHQNGTFACVSCHSRPYAFTNPAVKTQFSILPQMNLAWSNTFLWKGKVQGTLEDIMLFEVKNFFKTNLNAINQVREYRALALRAFRAESLSYEIIAKALAQFERTLNSFDSRYDHYLQGMATLTPLEELGMRIFFSERGDCFHCHGSILFTDNSLHNIGLDPTDTSRFKSPTLRNLVFTSPYMHDNRYTTLQQVIDFYSDSVHSSNPALDPLMLKGRPDARFHFTATEKQALIAFLLTLTDSNFVK